MFVSCPLFCVPCDSWGGHISQVAGRASAEHLGYLRDSGEGPRVRRKDIVEAVDNSLKRLDTDYIDLLQVCEEVAFSQ